MLCANSQYFTKANAWGEEPEDNEIPYELRTTKLSS